MTGTDADKIKLADTLHGVPVDQTVEDGKVVTYEIPEASVLEDLTRDEELWK